MKKIKCPECGAEYLPAEIFYPDSFFGHPKNIEKDITGKILFFDGKDMDFSEEYTCDYCKRKIIITGNISFQTNVQDFKKSHTTKFKKPSLFMSEN